MQRSHEASRTDHQGVSLAPDDPDASAPRRRRRAVAATLVAFALAGSFGPVATANAERCDDVACLDLDKLLDTPIGGQP